MEKIYLVTDYSGELYHGDWGGRAMKESGICISGRHTSSASELRKELLKTIPEGYEIIDMIEETIPEKFKLF